MLLQFSCLCSSKILYFLQNDEYKGLQETIIALKEQLSNSHDLRNNATKVRAQHYSETTSLQGELHTETENTRINDSADMLLQQAQVRHFHWATSCGSYLVLNQMLRTIIALAQC